MTTTHPWLAADVSVTARLQRPTLPPWCTSPTFTHGHITHHNSPETS
ncbi:hypothetical protein [Kibdelosporangium aridum]|nr:hypothetical protein [Kibdelosporangium aridum]